MTEETKIADMIEINELLIRASEIADKLRRPVHGTGLRATRDWRKETLAAAETIDILIEALRCSLGIELHQPEIPSRMALEINLRNGGSDD